MSSNPGDGIPPSSPNTSALPTFLEQDPYPSVRNGRPVSSAASDATSEFDAGPPYSIPSTTGPVGEPGLPPPRPLSGTSISTDYSQRGGTTRTSQPVPSSRRSAAAAVRRDVAVAQSTSPVNSSHVPSITAAGFTRPMSPQRLQAQRGNPVRTSGVAGVAPADEAREHRRRESNASVKTTNDAIPDTTDAPPLPVSRGTTNTGYADFLPPGAPSVGSKNSSTPLYAQQQEYQQDRSRLGAGGLTASMSPTPLTSRSNRSSLRASFGLNSRRSSKREDRRIPGLGHEKLASGPTSPVMAANEKQTITTTPPKSKSPSLAIGRNYKYFAGNMLFFGAGLCMNTRAKPLNVVTFILTALPSGLFAGFSAPWLWLHVSPAIPIVFAYVFYVTVSAFLHASFSDPGILPRNLHPHPPNPEEERDPLALGPPATTWVMVKSFAPPRNQPDESNAENGSAGFFPPAMEVPTKYCKSCNIWRPPRAHHCRVCDACIETQDHHCVWLNNCVGRRNYRYFFSFVGSASLLALCLIAFSLTHVILYGTQNNISFVASFTGRTTERVAFAMFLFSVLALPYPGCLFVYHLFLISRGETTREYLNSHKFPVKSRHRPFTQRRITSNWASVLLRPRHPPALVFHARHSPDDLRFGHTLPRSARKAAARRAAADRTRKVEGLRNRFSVGKEKPDAGAAAKGNLTAAPLSTSTPATANTDVELKKLPSSRGSMTAHPPPPPSSSAGRRTPDAAAGVKRGLVNRTPRQ